MQRISAKDHGGPKCPSVVPFEILNSEGPFEVANFEHFSLERHFNMAAMIVFTPKCPSKGDISHLECTDSLRKMVAGVKFFMVSSSNLKYKLMRHVTFNPLLFWIAPGLISCICI